MKSILVLICIMISIKGLQAQTNELLIKTNEKGLYIDHKVTPKENFYSIGRLFNVHPKHIASFNSLDMSKGLAIGQVIRIPLSDTNFNQKVNKGIPVYYVTGNNEALYRVSTNNNNVLLERIRKWNHLSNDKVPAGSKLIVGFLVSNEAATLTAANPQKPETIIKTNPENNKEVVKNEVINKPAVPKEEVKQVKEEPKRNEEIIPVKEEVKPQNINQGFFKTSFEQQTRQQPMSKEQTVTSGIFKTASGWTDGKYYLLMDGAEPGTIVRITNPANNKIIFAKLLGEMNSLKQNQGLTIRISNAAASALDIPETDKFIVKLNY